MIQSCFEHVRSSARFWEAKWCTTVKLTWEKGQDLIKGASNTQKFRLLSVWWSTNLVHLTILNWNARWMFLGCSSKHRLWLTSLKLTLILRCDHSTYIFLGKVTKQSEQDVVLKKNYFAWKMGLLTSLTRPNDNQIRIVVVKRVFRLWFRRKGKTSKVITWTRAGLLNANYW